MSYPEEKIESLEAMFGHFMVQTTTTIRHLERTMIEFAKQAEADRETMQRQIESIEQYTEELRKQAEEDRKQAEANRRQVEEDRKQAEANRERWDKKWDEFNRKSEADRQRFDKRWGELSQKLGTLVEDMVAPNMVGIAQTYFGFTDVEDFMVRRFVRNKDDRSDRREFDVIVVGNGKVIINETKSKVMVPQVDDFRLVLDKIYQYFPEYEGKTIIPVFSSLYIGEDVVNYLSKHKIYAMAMRKGTMDIVNFQQVNEQ